MSDYNYETIKAFVMQWYEKVLSESRNKDEIILSKNSDDALVIDFDFLNCIAQLSVTNSQYVPYQFVYFEAMDIEVTDLEDITPIYSFHDDSMQKDEVIGALDELSLVNFVRKIYHQGGILLVKISKTIILLLIWQKKD